MDSLSKAQSRRGQGIMSLKLQGKIHRYKMIEYSKAMGNSASAEAIRAAKHLFLVLAEHYNDKTGKCNPSIPTLMKFLEKSHGPTVSSKNLLIELGLVTVIKNAKGGRHSCCYALHFPRYEEFSHPVGRTDNAPEKRRGENQEQNLSHPANDKQPSQRQDASNPAERTRTLLETLNKPFLNPSENYEEIEKMKIIAEDSRRRIKEFLKNGNGGIKIFNTSNGL